jgi:hypothetical protein
MNTNETNRVPGRGNRRWLDPGRPGGAFLYAFLGALALWLLGELLPHIHITWS